MPTQRKPPGKGLMDKRQRILRSLHARLRYLAMCERLAPWPERPPTVRWRRRRQTSEQWAAYWEGHASTQKWSPRERPSLAHPQPGPDEVPDENVKAWIEQDPFVRGGLSPKTARAMAYIASFAPKVAQ